MGIVNETPTQTPGMKRVHPPLTEEDRGFARQVKVGSIALLAEDVPKSKDGPAISAEQVLEAAEARIQAVNDACEQLAQIVPALLGAAANLKLGGAALRDLLAEHGVKIEGRTVTITA